MLYIDYISLGILIHLNTSEMQTTKVIYRNGKEREVRGDFNKVVDGFRKLGLKVTECRVNPKNRTIWINGKNMATIVA
jgi:hypothetical protein